MNNRVSAINHTLDGYFEDLHFRQYCYDQKDYIEGHEEESIRSPEPELEEGHGHKSEGQPGHQERRSHQFHLGEIKLQKDDFHEKQRRTTITIVLILNSQLKAHYFQKKIMNQNEMRKKKKKKKTTKNKQTL